MSMWNDDNGYEEEQRWEGSVAQKLFRILAGIVVSFALTMGALCLGCLIAGIALPTFRQALGAWVVIVAVKIAFGGAERGERE